MEKFTKVAQSFFKKYYIISIIVIILIVLIYYFSIWKTINTFVITIDHCDLLFCDFIRHYYPMGSELFNSKVPVIGYYYTPFFAILLSFFGVFKLKTALWLWGLLQAFFTAFLFIIPGVYFFRKSKYLYNIYLLLLLTSFPILHNLKWGQVSIFLTLCVFGTLISYKKNKKIAGALLLAISFSIKYYTGIFIIYFIIKKDIKFVSYFLIFTIIFMIIIPFFTLGINNTINFYQIINEKILHLSLPIAYTENTQNFVNVLSRLNRSHALTSVGRIILRLIAYLIFLVNIFIIYNLSRKKIEDEIYLAFILLFLSIPLLVETSWPHYFVYLPFCQVAIGSWIWLKEKRMTISLHSILLLVSIFISNIIFFNFIGDWRIYGTHGYLFFANIFLLIIVYLSIFSKFRTKS